MPHIDLGPPKKEYTPKTLASIFTLIQTGVNFLNETNFPYGIVGTIIKAGTLRGVALKSGDVPLYKLEWREWPIPLVLLGETVTTNSLTGKDLGGYFAWNPLNFPGVGKWYLEASMAIADVSATATCTLKGSAEYASVTTQETALTRVRSAQITMPAIGENLWVALKTDNASHLAALISARLIFVPG